KPPRHPPRGNEPLEISVEPGEAEQIERQREKPIELLFGAAALHELTDLAPDGGGHREEGRFPFANPAAEEPHDAENLGAEHDRKPEACPQPGFGGCGRPREILVATYVVDECRPPRLPDAAGQPDA